MDCVELVAEFRRELPFYLRCTEVTAEKSAYQAARYLRWQSDPFPACMTRQHILRFLSHLASTPPEGRDKARREASSVNDILKGIRRFSRWCLARGYLDADPSEDIKGLAERKPVILAPEMRTVARLLAVAREHGESEESRLRNHAMLSALIDIGPRAAELLGMDCADIFAGARFRRVIVLRGKGGKERLAPLTPRLRSALRPYLKLRRALPGERALWLDTYGQRMSYPALRNVLKRICAKSGVQVGLHDFRRYSHTQYWLSGISLRDGMAISGHAVVKDYTTYIQRGVQERAVIEARKRSPLAALAGAGD